jgi:UDP-N-acetylmuramate--alanine ligase
LYTPTRSILTRIGVRAMSTRLRTGERPWEGRRLHFVGVGGAGMSGYARAAHALGATVSGSDRTETPYLKRLREEGVLDALIGHDASNLPPGSDVELVYSSAVTAENPERRAARERGLPDRPRAELLAQLSALRRTIAVAGAHGKTTTSSMIVHILRAAGIDPGWLVGSSVGAGLENSHWSAGEWLVVEADESDRSMLSLDVEIAVLTNVELDHHAAFRSIEQLREAFREFLSRARYAVVVWDHPDLLALLEPADADRGVDRSAPEVVRYDVPTLTLQAGGSRFQWRGSEVQLSVPGRHNALNAAGALEVARLVALGSGDGGAVGGGTGTGVGVGVRDDDARAAMTGFRGAARRFERVGVTRAGAVVIDDYAHHPTEVAATLSAARTFAPERLVAVFQPHLYSRTAMLAEEFGAALAEADLVVVLDVYPARERAEDFPGIGGHMLVRATIDHLQQEQRSAQILWAPTFNDAEAILGDLLDVRDLVVVMGAGDIDALAHRLVRVA